jgi:hypothetical protein
VPTFGKKAAVPYINPYIKKILLKQNTFVCLSGIGCRAGHWVHPVLAKR